LRVYLKLFLTCIMLFTFVIPPTFLPTTVPSTFASDLQKPEPNQRSLEESVGTTTKELTASHENVVLKLGESTTVRIFEKSKKEKRDITKKVSWDIQKKDIVSIDGGKITAKAVGTTNVDVKYGEQQLKIKVEVTPLQKAPLIKVREVEGKAVLTWDNLNAEMYSVKRRLNNGDYEVIGTNITDNQFTDDNIERDGTYYYKVDAQYSDGSTLSSKSAKLKTDKQKVDFSLEVESSTLFLVEGDTKALNIVAKLSDGTKNNVSKRVKWTIEDKKIVSITNGKIKAKKQGKTLVTGSYNKKKVSFEVNVSEKNSFNLSVQQEKDQILLSWGLPKKNTKYIVERRVENDKFTPLTDEISDTHYNDSSVEEGVTYYYRVISIEDTGTQTTSNEVSVQLSQEDVKLVPSLDTVELKIGGSKKVILELEYPDGKKVDVTNDSDWIIRDESVVTVKQGEITALKSGKTFINARYKEKEIQIDVRVNEIQEYFKLSVDGNDQENVLSWEEIDNVKSYTVKRRVKSGEYEELAKNLKVTTFVDNKLNLNDSTYYYAVTGITETGELVTSNEVEISSDKSISQLSVWEYITIGKDEHYTVSNTTSTSQRLNFQTSTTNNKLLDLALYDANNLPTRIEMNFGGSYILIPVGGELDITGATDNPVTIGYPKDKFSFVRNDKPALLRKTLNLNQSYTYINNSSKYFSGIENNFIDDRESTAVFDYVHYNNQKKKIDTKKSVLVHDSLAKIYIEGTSQVNITNTSDVPITFAAPFRTFTGLDRSSPSIEEYLLKPNESYTLTRNDESNGYTTLILNDQINDAYKYDYVLYDIQGNGIGDFLDYTYSCFVKLDAFRVVLTNSSQNDVIFYAPFDFFEGSVSKNPALYRQTLTKDQSTTLTNNSEKQYSINTTANSTENKSFNFISYKSDGSIYEEGSNSDLMFMSVPPKGKIYIKNISEYPIVVGGYFEFFKQADKVIQLLLDTPIDINNETEQLFVFTAPASGNYRFFTSPYAGNGPENDTILQLYADAKLSSVLAENDNVPNGPYGDLYSKIEYSLNGGTTYYLKLSSANGSLNTRLQVEAIDADSTRAGAIPTNWDEIYTDRLSSRYDVDYFVLQANEMAYMNLYVTKNLLILEDQNGNELKRFHSSEEDTLFVTETSGTYYAKVVWSSNPLVSGSISAMDIDIGGSYDLSLHDPKRISKNFAVDTSPGYEKSVTLQWKFTKPHPYITIQVLRKGQVVYEESRTNQAASYHTFTWNGMYTKINPGQWAETGLYIVRIKASDAPGYPINIPLTVLNTIPNEEYDIQYLISKYNQDPNISSSTIREVQEGLKEMEFYDGPITGEYNEDFLLSVISFEVVLNRSAHIGVNTGLWGTDPLGEKGEITSQLLNYVRVSLLNNRDKYGKFAEFLFSGDVVIYETGLSLVPAFRIYKISGKLIKKAGKTFDELYECNCFTAGTKVLTELGERNIEEINVGDRVLSKNEETREISYKEVTHLYRNEKNIIYEISVGNQTIETTDNHPFWVENKGWVLAADLKVGDKLQQSNGNTLTIDKINIVEYKEAVRVYNFTVADYNTYFVSNLGIWVHNIGDGCAFGELLGMEIYVTREGLDTVKKHISRFDPWAPNEAMIKRLENALQSGKRITGADASFYTHELAEYEFMQNGMSYDDAHKAAFDKYDVSPFTVYHPDVIKAYPGEFSTAWFEFWGITR